MTRQNISSASAIVAQDEHSLMGRISTWRPGEMKFGFGGAGFSLWNFALAHTNPHRLKPAPPKSMVR
jgi:hypothetical protein